MFSNCFFLILGLMNHNSSTIFFLVWRVSVADMLIPFFVVVRYCSMVPPASVDLFTVRTMVHGWCSYRGGAGVLLCCLPDL